MSREYSWAPSQAHCWGPPTLAPSGPPWQPVDSSGCWWRQASGWQQSRDAGDRGGTWDGTFHTPGGSSSERLQAQLQDWWTTEKEAEFSQDPRQPWPALLRAGGQQCTPLHSTGGFLPPPHVHRRAPSWACSESSPTSHPFPPRSGSNENAAWCGRQMRGPAPAAAQSRAGHLVPGRRLIYT